MIKMTVIIGFEPETESQRLQRMKKSELEETFFNEIITYRANLSAGLRQEREQITQEYMQRTKLLREEIDKREQLYLEYHHNKFTI